MRRHLAPRFPVFALAALLALKAAVPMLASLAAQAQGRPVAEICDVYGVAVPQATAAAAPGPHHSVGHGQGHASSHESLHASLHENASSHAPPHGGSHDPARPHGPDHCALSALVALARGADGQAGVPAAEPAVRLGPASGDAPQRRDDAAREAARLDHGPPSLS